MSNVNEQVHQSALTLANAGALGTAVIRRAAGNDISNAINGSKITAEMMQNMIMRKIATKISMSNA